MKNFKVWLSILWLLSSLIFIAIDHRGEEVGDYIFNLIGIPPWSDSDNNQGQHYSSIFGITILILSAGSTIEQLRKLNYKYVGRTTMIFGILFFYVYPILTEQYYYLINKGKTGIEVIDFLKDDSRCTYMTKKDMLSIQCTMRIVNYGRQSENVEVRPIMRERGDSQDVWSFAEVKYQAVDLAPRSNMVYNLSFESKPDERIAKYSASGAGSFFGLEILKDGQQKRKD